MNPTKKVENIYAFCDRWCERCAFGARCAAYAANELIRKPENLEKDDEKNKRFWEEIENHLPDTLTYIQQKAREKEADLHDFPGVSKRAKFDLFQRKTVNNMVLKAGRLYEDKVDDFLDEAADAGKIVMDELQPGSVFTISGNLFPDAEKKKANDLIAVVMRYQLQLYLKLSRAYYSKGLEEEESIEDKNPRESEGTAKVCLLLIHRSLVAWYGLLAFFPEKGDAIDEILFLLVRMKNRLEEEFPGAYHFVRPGFDQ